MQLVNAHHVKIVPGRKTDLLTELSDRSLRAVRAAFRLGWLGSVARDQRRGCAAGVVRAGGAAARFA